MKNKIINCLAATSIALILLSIVATLYQAHFLCINTVYQVLLANVVIHIGLGLLERFESTYFLLEVLAEVGYVLMILIIFGFLFDWYSSTPLWVLILLGIAIYLIGSLIGFYRINSNLAFINKQLSTAKQKKTNQ